MGLKLGIETNADTVPCTAMAGEAATGSVTVAEGGHCHRLVIELRYIDESFHFDLPHSAARVVPGVTLHGRGELKTGSWFPFSLRVPTDAMPNIEGQNGCAGWHLVATGEHFGPDARALVPISIDGGAGPIEPPAGGKQHRVKHFGIKGAELELDRRIVRRGESVRATLAVEPDPDREPIEISLVCTERYIDHRLSIGGPGDANGRRAHIPTWDDVRADWKPVDRQVSHHEFDFSVPADALPSFEGDAFSVQWAVEVREAHRGLGLVRRRDQTLWVTL